jgi:hypothetical protein
MQQLLLDVLAPPKFGDRGILTEIKESLALVTPLRARSPSLEEKHGNAGGR